MTIINKDELAASVKEVFAATLKVEQDKIQPDTMLRDDLNLDSLDMMEVVYELEDKFDVQIPEEKIVSVTTFTEVVDQLHEALIDKDDEGAKALS